MKNIYFTGIIPALVTPIDENQNIKREVVSELLDMQLEAGVHGFYVCGNTGEGPRLKNKTRMDMLETTLEQNRNRGKIIAHIGASNMVDAIELTRHATEAGADGIASLPPASFQYSQRELVDYYKTIADNTDLPVLLYAYEAGNVYNFPKLMEEIMTIPNVVGLKCTLSNYYHMWQIKGINNGDVNVINGPDETLLCGLSMGADGGIGSTYNIMPKWFCELYEGFLHEDMKRATAIQYRINRVIEILISYGVIASVKATLSLMGFDVGAPAPPAMSLSKEGKRELKDKLIELGLKL